MFTCYFIRRRLVAYIHGQVSLRARRRIARHLERCSSCRAAAQQEQDAVRMVEREIARLGQPQPAQLERVWSAVQAELNPGVPKQRRWELMPLRYGFAALLALLILGLLAPMTAVEGASPTLPAQAVAPTAIAQATDSPPMLHTADRMRTTVFATGDVTLKPQAALTPTPVASG